MEFFQFHPSQRLSLHYQLSGHFLRNMDSYSNEQIFNNLRVSSNSGDDNEDKLSFAARAYSVAPVNGRCPEIYCSEAIEEMLGLKRLVSLLKVGCFLQKHNPKMDLNTLSISPEIWQSPSSPKPEI